MIKKMTSNWYAEDSVYGSQNFNLRLSENSTIEDTCSSQHSVTKEDEGDVIIISDSSCSSSPMYTDKSNWKYNFITVRNKPYQKLDFLEVFSESEKETGSSDSNFTKRDNEFSQKKSTNKTVVQINETLTDTLSISDSSLTYNDALMNDKIVVSKNTKHDKDEINKFKYYNNDRSPRLIRDGEINSKPRECISEKIDGRIKPRCAIDSPDFFNRHQICNPPKQDSTGKSRLTKKDVHKILKNVKYTQVVYNSPREKKQDIIISESPDRDDDILHPAISPNYIKNIQHLSPDVIDTSVKNNIVQASDSTAPNINMTKVMDTFRPLSKRRKKQITNWVLTSCPNSQTDSSFNTVPPSTRNSNSGNSSLERLEMTHETPNNRGRIKKTQNCSGQKTTRQTTLDQYFKKTKNNSEFFTSDNKSRLSPKAQIDKKNPSVNTLKNEDVIDCADILDKLYGTSWRDRANVLIPKTEPRKAPVKTINKIVQTERKPLPKNRNRAVDLASNRIDLTRNIKSNRKKNIQQREKEMEDFINDESLSSNDNESIYYSALTNPTVFRNTSIKSSTSASIKRLQVCDTDTEDEDDRLRKALNNLHGRKLSFTDDESSSTSEFDPGDYVPPKQVRNKEVKKPLSSKKATKFKLTTKNVEHKSFLASLSNTVPMNQIHPDAKKYRLDFKNSKEELCQKLYNLYNEKIFDNMLPKNMSIEWNIHMRKTAGYCYNKKCVKSLTENIVKSSRIVLATKILDTPDRLRDTLIHEMCHAASWIINNVSDGHGPLWTKWANKAMKTFPELPPIRRCHNYEIKTKFTYRCTQCGYSIGRHSKSLDVEIKRCGYCFGKFELLINKTTKFGTEQVRSAKKEPTGFALFVKQNYNSVKKEKNKSMKHADVMKVLGQQFSAIKIGKKTDVSN